MTAVAQHQASFDIHKRHDYLLLVDKDNGVSVAADVKAVVVALRSVGMVNDSSIIVLRDPFGKYDRVKPDGSLSYLDAENAEAALAA
jgi:hypothetical protein